MPGKRRLVARIGWIMAAVSGPPAIAMGIWRDSLMNNPAVAIISLLTYEVVLAVIIFTGGVVGELRKRWRERLVDHIDRSLRRRFTRFDRRYREFVLAGLRFIDLKGLATIGPYTPELDEVFVDVSLAPRAPNQVPGGLVTELPKEVTERHSIREFLDRPEAAVLAVIGVPGSGKTTLLRYMARQVCRDQRNRQRTVPILLYLRDHAGTIASTPEVALPALLRGTLERYRDEEPPGWFEQRLRDGDCVILLDGLDEVARQEDRRSVADWVERQVRQYPKNDYVITSRPQGYRTAPIDGATVLQVRGFTDEQVTRFVRGWYLAVERRSTGAEGEDVRLRAESEADDLLRRLNNAPGLYDLRVNPLLLTMIANVHRYRGALPGNRVDLYGEICQVMLWRRQEAKKVPIELDGDKKEALLRGLAFAMMQQRVRDLPRAEILDKLRPTLRRMSRDLRVEDFLADIGSNGLLLERESGLYSFAHLTFQEYLAAAHIRDKKLHHVLASAVDDTWWRETTLLYAARSDADPIVQACLESRSVPALLLAFDCADQNSELAPELRDRLDELLASAFAPETDPERRRLMASVMVTRHLRHPIRTDKSGHVCPRPITTGLYWLYQQDTQAPLPDGTTQLEPNTNLPVLGVRGSDAVAFTHWVNVRTGTETVYRLPNLAEINDLTVQRVLIPALGAQSFSAWLDPEDAHGTPRLWTSVDADHPHTIDATTLTKHLEEDFERSDTPTARLLPLRSIIAVCLLVRALDRAHDRARDLARSLARDLALARARDLYRELDFARDLARELRLAHELALDLTLDLNRSLDLYRSLARDLNRALDRALDLAGTLDHDIARDIELARDLALTRAHVRDLVRALDLARARDLDLASNLTLALALTLNRDPGSALSWALTHTFTGKADTGWLANFSQAFIEVTGIVDNRFLPSPDVLEHRVHSARDALVGIFEHSTYNVSSHPWAYQAVNNFVELALPIFARERPLTADTATVLRITALCLAAEADTRDAQPVGDTFREIAAGVTLLERRANGQAPPTETIILALA